MKYNCYLCNKEIKDILYSYIAKIDKRKFFTYICNICHSKNKKKRHDYTN